MKMSIQKMVLSFGSSENCGAHFHMKLEFLVRELVKMSFTNFPAISSWIFDEPLPMVLASKTHSELTKFQADGDK